MIPHSPVLSDVDEREAVRQLALLDPCSAWRADLADAGLTEPMDEALADQWLLWLQIATVFDRLRSLPVAARAAYARSTTALWETAERVTGAARFARVGAVMAAWEGAAPELAGYRELLWAVEQGEAEGALRMSICGLIRLRGLLGARDVRPSYAGAQLARALRTAGFLQAARREFESSLRVATKRADSWLQARVELGLAVLHQSTGNYPAARTAFVAVVDGAREHRDVCFAAHIGVVSAALTLGRFDEAIVHAGEALELAVDDADEQVEVLAMLADVALEIGQFDLALRSCAHALTLRLRRQRRHFFERGAVVAAAVLGEHEATLRYLTDLESSVSTTTNPWERSLGELVLGKVCAQINQEERGCRFLERAVATAKAHGFHEIEWKAENSLFTLLRRADHETGSQQHRQPRELEEASRLMLASIGANKMTAWRSSSSCALELIGGRSTRDAIGS